MHPPKKKKNRDGQETKASTRKPLHKGHRTMIELWYSSQTKLNILSFFLVQGRGHSTPIQAINNSSYEFQFYVIITKPLD